MAWTAHTNSSGSITVCNDDRTALQLTCKRRADRFLEILKEDGGETTAILFPLDGWQKDFTHLHTGKTESVTYHHPDTGSKCMTVIGLGSKNGLFINQMHYHDEEPDHRAFTPSDSTHLIIDALYQLGVVPREMAEKQIKQILAAAEDHGDLAEVLLGPRH